MLYIGYRVYDRTVSSEHQFLGFFTALFSVPCGRLSWRPVSFRAHVNVVYRIVSQALTTRDSFHMFDVWCFILSINWSLMFLLLDDLVT